MALFFSSKLIVAVLLVSSTVLSFYSVAACPEGFHLDYSSQKCMTAAQNKCPAGYSSASDACIALVPSATSCISDYSLVGGKCIKRLEAPIKKECPPDSVKVIDNTNEDGYICRAATTHSGERVCNHGFVHNLDLNKCVATQTTAAICTCGDGAYKLHNNKCIVKNTSKCISGSSMNVRGTAKVDSNNAAVGVIGGGDGSSSSASSNGSCLNEAAEPECRCPEGTHPLKHNHKTVGNSDILNAYNDSSSSSSKITRSSNVKCVKVEYRDVLPKCEDKQQKNGTPTVVLDSDDNETSLNDCYTEAYVDKEYTCSHLNHSSRDHSNTSSVRGQFQLSCSKHDATNTIALSTSNGNLKNPDRNANTHALLNPRKCVCKYTRVYTPESTCPKGYYKIKAGGCARIVKPVYFCTQGDLERGIDGVLKCIINFNGNKEEAVSFS